MVKMNEQELRECFDFESILKKAEDALSFKPEFITDHLSVLSKGGPHDYYSNADYWWSNPDTADGLPFIQRDGESNPGMFKHHRMSLRNMRTNTVNLAAGYYITGDERFAEKAVNLLKGFFLDDETKMNPHLLYAQAIPGVCDGRGIGIIDTLHLIDVPVAINILKASKAMTEDIYKALQDWFAEYLRWISTHQQGIDEMNTKNNHSVCWHVQAASFAKFTGNTEMLENLKRRFKEILVPNQIAGDGTFPEEMRRTKPYNYSNFVVDNMVNLCNILSDENDNLWEYAADGKSIKKAVEVLYPYIEDINSWPYRKDVQHFDQFPAAMPFLIFAGLAYNKPEYIKTWKQLAVKPQDDEMRRNIAVRQPLIWLIK